MMKTHKRAERVRLRLCWKWNVLCRRCAGRGEFTGVERYQCSDCVGTGLDAIPLTELFVRGTLHGREPK